MKTNSKEVELKIAHARCISAAEALERIQSVIPQTANSGAQPEGAALERARLHLEDCLAARRLGESSAEDETNARAALVAAQKAFDVAQAVSTGASLEYVGLNRRLVAAEQAAEEANTILKSAECEWLSEEFRNAEEMYVKQAAAILQSYALLSACTAALQKRGAPKGGIFSSAQDLEIPTVGEISCAEYKSKHPSEAHGVGKYLVRAGRYLHIAPPSADVEGALVAVTAAKSSTAASRFAKAVSGLMPGADK